MIRKALLAGFLVSSLAHAADFTGHWTGTGQLTEKNPFTGNKTTPCSLIDVSVEQLPTRLTIRKYHAICGAIDSDWGPSVLEIREGRIYEDGEETGTFDGELLKTLQPSGSVQYAFNLRLREQPESILETYYGVRNMLGAMVIEGNLKPAR